MKRKSAMWELEGKRVLITGASRGIGKCMAESFGMAGATVLAPGRVDLDLRDEGSIEQYFNAGNREVDIFIHCAGVNLKADIEHIDRDLLQEVFQVNAFSAATLIKQIAPHMKKQMWGRILLVSSLYAIVSRECRIAYSMSKNALTGLAKTLSLELAPMSVLTNCVAPGYVLTDMTKKNLSETELQEIVAAIPTGRLQSEQEIADLALFLCSNFNQSITGQVISVDGGFTCR